MVFEKIQRRAEIWNISLEKAAIEQFREYPADYPIYKAEVTEKQKRVSEDREYVNDKMQHEIWMVGRRENLNLENPADLAKATTIAANENPEWYKRSRQSNSTRVGKTELPLIEG